MIGYGYVPQYTMTKVKLFTDSYQDFQLKYQTSRKDHAPIEGKPRWEIRDGAEGVLLKVSGDGFIGRIIAKDGITAPDEKIIVRTIADADLGEGVEEIVHDFEIEIVHRRASAVVVSALTSAQDIPDEVEPEEVPPPNNVNGTPTDPENPAAPTDPTDAVNPDNPNRPTPQPGGPVG